ncbi:hypothetical protein LCGC14_2710050 [marine sediment metagenome]|uniref:Uncharacterized protein n=1 Tax=marine sediment metagenome TaxID=412755 RepID=A0A0F9C4W7_9ZZZZ
MTKREATEKLFTILEPEVREIVERIESKAATTQNHYGDYMSAIASLQEALRSIPVSKSVIALLLVMGGANSDGVSSALKLS